MLYFSQIVIFSVKSCKQHHIIPTNILIGHLLVNITCITKYITNQSTGSADCDWVYYMKRKYGIAALLIIQ